MISFQRNVNTTEQSWYFLLVVVIKIIFSHFPWLSKLNCLKFPGLKNDIAELKDFHSFSWPTPTQLKVFQSLRWKLFHFSNVLKLACSVGILLGRANVISSRSFMRPAMFDLELEWIAGVWREERAIFTPPPPPLPIFLTVDCPLGT